LATSFESQSIPEWKHYLSLIEKLIDQPTIDKQCQTIQTIIQDYLGARSTVWLAKPYFPLGGDSDKNVLPGARVSKLVRNSYNQQLIKLGKKNLSTRTNKYEPDDTNHLVFPLISQNNLLGILEVSRIQGNSFNQNEIDFLEAFSAHAAVSIQIFRQVTIKNWQLEQLSLVRKVSEQVANIFDLNTFYEKIVTLIQTTFNYYAVSIFLLNGKTKSLDLKASSSPDQVDQTGLRTTISINDGIIGFVARKGQEIIAADIRNESLFKPNNNYPNTKSEATFPLKINKKTLGVLDIQSDRLSAFDENDVIVLEALANSIALAVQDAELYGSLTQRAEQLSSILEVSQAINSFLALDELLEKIIQIIVKRFGFNSVHIFTVHKGRRKIFYQAGSFTESKELVKQGFNFDFDDEGIISWVTQNGIIAISNDTSQDHRFTKQRLSSQIYLSELVVPLIYVGEILGILVIQSEDKNSINEHDLFIFEAIASTISSALRNANLFRSEQWRYQVAESFRSVINMISSNTELDQLLMNILEKLNEILPCDVSAIWLMDHQQENIEDLDPELFSPAATWNITKEELTDALKQDPASWDLLKLALINDEPTIRTDNKVNCPFGVALSFQNDYSSIATPLKIGEQLLGILTLAHHTSRRYGEEAKIMSSTFANYAAVAIHNARLYSEAQEQAWISTVMLQVSQACQTSETTEDLLETMVRLTPMLVGIKKCAFYFWNPFENYFFQKAEYGFKVPLNPVWTMEMPIVNQALNSYSPIFITNTQEEIFMAQTAENIPEYDAILLPMRARGDLLGFFLVFHEARTVTDENNSSDEMISILQSIVQQTAVSLDNMRLLEARQEEAYVTAVLLQVAQAVVTQPNLSDTFDTIVNLLPLLIGVNACIIYLPDDLNENSFKAAGIYTDNEIHSSIFTSLEFCEQNPLLNFVNKYNQIAYAHITNEELTNEKYHTIQPLPYIQEIKMEATDHLLIAFPINLKGELLGILLTKEDNLSPQYFEKRIELLNGVSQEIALAIQNFFLQKDILQRKKLEQEILLARQIQKTFLPDSLPILPGWQIQTRWETALQVGGDFYDIILISKQRIGLVIADVADKGLAASLYMTVARTLIRAFGQTIADPGGILSAVNNLLVGDTPNGMFVTAVFAMLDLQTGKIYYSNAGHNRPIIIRAHNNETEELPQGDMALGVVEDIQYRNMEVSLEPGDFILFYTDGLTETFSADGEQYGVARTIDFLKNNHHIDVNLILENLDRELFEYRDGQSLSDDLTLIGLKREQSN